MQFFFSDYSMRNVMRCRKLYCNVSKNTTAEKETVMYFPPMAECLLPESEDIMDLNLFLASTENDETDNETSIDDLLGGLL